MPTYEYACENCGHQMEVFQSMNAERLVKCPACSKDGLKRLIGRGAALIFKGTGFYETDYKSPPKSDSGTSGESKSSESAAKDSSAAASAASSASSGDK